MMNRSPKRKSKKKSPQRHKIRSMSIIRLKGQSKWKLYMRDKDGTVRSTVVIDTEKDPVKLVPAENASCGYSSITKDEMEGYIASAKILINKLEDIED